MTCHYVQVADMEADDAFDKEPALDLAIYMLVHSPHSLLLPKQEDKGEGVNTRGLKKTQNTSNGEDKSKGRAKGPTGDDEYVLGQRDWQQSDDSNDEYDGNTALRHTHAIFVEPFIQDDDESAANNRRKLL